MKHQTDDCVRMFVPTRPPPGVVVSAAQTERHQGEVPLLINTDTVVPSS